MGAPSSAISHETEIYFVNLAATAALIVSIIQIKKQCAKTLSNALLTSSAPPRRAGHAPAQFLQLRSRPEPTPTPKHIPAGVKDREDTAGSFNATLYALKAFGIATMIVGVSSTATVWGVTTIMGVKTVRLFKLGLFEK
jgi:hypothetical protein